MGLDVELSLLCDYCDQPGYKDIGRWRYCRRHYGYLELASVILHPERCTKEWSYKRGAKLRISA
jgi:hypothetical protein